MSLPKMIQEWSEASRRPGIIGRAGWSNVVKFRAAVAGYFEVMAADLQVPSSAHNHYGLIEPALRAVMAKNQSLLLQSYTAHARTACLVSAELDIFTEADGAKASLPGTAKATKDLVGKLDKLGLTGQQAVDYIIAHGGVMVKSVDAYTLKVMRSIIAQGIEDQRGVDGTVRMMRAEFRTMKTARARSIATTEMNDAMSEVALNKIRSVGLDGKRWIISSGACPICAGNAAQGIIPVDQPFQSGHMRPPGHPGKCRCAVAGGRLSK